jgi:hypothetical protein
MLRGGFFLAFIVMIISRSIDGGIPDRGCAGAAST